MTTHEDGSGERPFPPFFVPVFSVANPTPTHILGGTGMGQEHFEAMMAQTSNP